MQKKYQDSLNERKNLENRKEIIRMRLKRAVDLTEALDVEKVRWRSQYEDLFKKADSIIGVTLICSAAINYLGFMTQDYREKLLKNWINYCEKEMGKILIFTGLFLSIQFKHTIKTENFILVKTYKQFEEL
jgi:hypothetical protein